MPLPSIVEITSHSHGKMSGSSEMYGQNDCILAYAFNHGVRLNTDTEDEDNADIRLHEPFTIVKQTDKSSPILKQHLTRSLPISEVAIRLYSPVATGRSVNFHTIILSNALVTEITSESPISFLKENDAYRHMETVSFSYAAIRWIHADPYREFAQAACAPEDIAAIAATVPAAPLVLGDKKDFIRILCVDADTMAVVSGIKVRLTLGDGSFVQAFSSPKGYISFDGAPKGSFSVSGSDLKTEPMRLDACYSVVSLKKSDPIFFGKIKQPDKKTTQSRHWKSLKHIAAITETQVSKGALFSDIAAQNGFDVSDLAYFNWGSRSGKQSLKQMKRRFDTGELAASGNEYHLNDGSVYLPGLFKQQTLQTGTLYLMTLKNSGKRNVKVTVKSSKQHPVIGVEATVTLADDTRYKAVTDTEGIATFPDIPADIEGKLAYEDEADCLVRTFAANLNGAINEKDFAFCVQLLHSAVDYEAVKIVFRQLYKKNPGPTIQAAFTEATQSKIILYLLLANKLIDVPGVTLVQEESA